MKRVLLSAMIIAAQAGLAFNTQAAAEKPETSSLIPESGCCQRNITNAG